MKITWTSCCVINRYVSIQKKRKACAVVERWIVSNESAWNELFSNGYLLTVILNENTKTHTHTHTLYELKQIKYSSLRGDISWKQGQIRENYYFKYDELQKLQYALFFICNCATRPQSWSHKNRCIYIK